MYNLMDVTEGSCKYNDGVMCAQNEPCSKCGWCPAVHEKRVQKIRAMNEAGAFCNLREKIANGETTVLQV